MHQPIPMHANRWCILRTSGGRTLKLADSLIEAGFEAWTPRRTFKRPKVGRCTLIDGRKPTIEMEAPILPTFVFARASHLFNLEALASDPASPHPAFSIFRYSDFREANRIPLVSDSEVRGLQDAERAATEAIEAQRDAETREEAERFRIAAMNTERARIRALKMAERERLKMLRSERRDFSDGEGVVVDDVPAMSGMGGVVQSSDGRFAIVNFGGSLTMKIEAWQLSRDRVQAALS